MEILAIAVPLLFIFLVALFVFFAAIKIVNQYERMLVFTLGRTSPGEVKGPGWVFVVPIAQRGIRVDLREQFIEVPSQTNITKDNAPISIDFLIYWRIADPYKSVVEVQNFNGALQNIATTTLRAAIGDQCRRRREGGDRPPGRRRPAGGDPAGRGLLARARADLPGRFTGRSEDDGAA